jgi:hypothetical protein
VITWPDGRTTRIDDPPVNALLSIAHPDVRTARVTSNGKAHPIDSAANETLR